MLRLRLRRGLSAIIVTMAFICLIAGLNTKAFAAGGRTKLPVDDTVAIKFIPSSDSDSQRFTLYEGIDGSYPYFIDGDKLELTFKDNSKETATYKAPYWVDKNGDYINVNGEGYLLGGSYCPYVDPYAGSENNIEYQGLKCTTPWMIKKNPIKSVTYKQVHPVEISEMYEDYYEVYKDFDSDDLIGYYYYEYKPAEGDKITIVSDSVTKEYTCKYDITYKGIDYGYAFVDSSNTPAMNPVGYVYGWSPSFSTSSVASSANATRCFYTLEIEGKKIEPGIYTFSEFYGDGFFGVPLKASIKVVADTDKSRTDENTDSEKGLDSKETTNTADQKAADGTAVGNGASAAAAEKAITCAKNDNDPTGSVFGVLQLKSSKQANSAITLSWKKAKGAKKYVVYGNACGKKNKMKKLKTLSKNTFTVKKIAKKKLKKGTYHKFIVVALDKNNNVVSTSKVIHVATKGGKVGNNKSVTTKAKKNKVTLKKGKSFKLAGKAVAASKKLKVKKHRAVCYETSNKKVATVSKKGVIKGIKKGKCKVYAYSQDGQCKIITVTVK